MKRAVKKPTIHELTHAIVELRGAVNQMIYECKDLKSAFASYMHFKGDTDKWIKWVNKKSKEAEKKEK